MKKNSISYAPEKRQNRERWTELLLLYSEESQLKPIGHSDIVHTECKCFAKQFISCFLLNENPLRLCTLLFRHSSVLHKTFHGWLSVACRSFDRLRPDTWGNCYSRHIFVCKSNNDCQRCTNGCENESFSFTLWMEGVDPTPKAQSNN